MLVVADTTPLNYLVLIGQVTVLASLYEQVVIPNAVATELRHPKAPEVVRAWIASPPLMVYDTPGPEAPGQGIDASWRWRT
jgi:hypothetical protein